MKHVVTHHSFTSLKSLDFSSHKIVQPSFIFQFRTFSSPHKNLHACYWSVSFYSSSSRGWPLTHLLFLWMCLFWTLHISGFVWHMVFLWLAFLSLTFPRPIRPALCVFIPLRRGWRSSAGQSLSYLFSHQSLGHWIVSACQLLWITLLWTSSCTFLCGYLCSFFLGTYLGLELLDHMVAVHLTSGGIAKLFQIDRTVLRSYQK